MSTINDLTGLRFGRLTIIKRADDYISPKGARHVQWECKCDCGKSVVASSCQLNSGNAKSCGCLRKEIYKRGTHHMSNTRLFRIWASMHKRCENKNDTKDYPRYGGRGIIVCNEWSGKSGFENFFKWAMENGYSDNLTIDRKDVNGNYEPSNCRWADRKTQNRNRRDTKIITAFGITKPLVEFCEEYQINKTTVNSRVKDHGMTYEQALTMPLLRKKKVEVE